MSDEPIAFRDEDAFDRLAGIADLLLVHDRPIDTRTDDSVGRVVSLGDRRQAIMLRRSRGYVPASLPLPEATAHPILACGAELKKRSASPAARGPGWGTTSATSRTTRRSRRLPRVSSTSSACLRSPEVVAHDLHPESCRRSTRSSATSAPNWRPASPRPPGRRTSPNITSREIAVGAIFDGTGYGGDGTVWGGELLCGDIGGFERVGMLMPVRLPAAPRRSGSPGGWRARGSPRPATPPRPPFARGGCPRLGAGRAAGRDRSWISGDIEHGPAVRCGGGAVRTGGG